MLPIRRNERRGKRMKINAKQLEMVNRQVQRILESGNYYSEVYKKVGITGVHSEEDFLKIPFTDKADLRNAYPLGIQAVPEEQVVRIHSSSGTTGKPVIIPYTAKDVDDWATMFARCYEIAGVTNRDGSILPPDTASGPRASASRPDARRSAPWQFPWVPATRKNSCR